MRSIQRLWAVIGIIALIMAMLPGAVLASTEQILLFERAENGSYTVTIPKGAGELTVELYGGGGGGGGGTNWYWSGWHEHSGGHGGGGGHLTVTRSVLPTDWEQELSITVGNGRSGGDGGTYDGDNGRDGYSSVVTGPGFSYSAAGGGGGKGAELFDNGAPGTNGGGYLPDQTHGQGGAGGNPGKDGKPGDDGYVKITYTLVEYQLSVNTDGEGFGDVLVYADDTYIGSDGGYTLTYGTAIKVVAAPEWCSYFDGWQGDYPEGEQDNPELEFELTGDVSLTALFELLTCDVEVGATEGGSVYIDYEGMFVPRGLVLDGEDDFEFLVGPGDSEDVTIYCCNSYFVLKAVPEDGWLFSHWELEGDVYPACEYTVQSEVFTAAYEESDPLTENPAAFVVDCGEGEGDCSGMITAVFVEEPGGEGSITVNVIKSDGGDVGGIAVSFGGDLSATVHTNSSGVAKVNGLWAGDYTANASAADYTSNGPKSVELEDDDSDESVTITLTPVPPAPPEPGPGAIEGKAEDGTTAAGLPGVLVRLLDSTDTIIGIKMTDAAGEFGFDGLEPGSYTVRGSLDGYGADTEVAVVVNDATTEVALQLAAVIVVPPTPPAGEPVVTPPDLPKTGATLTGLLIVSGLALGAGVFAKRRGF